MGQRKWPCEYRGFRYKEALKERDKGAGYGVTWDMGFDGIGGRAFPKLGDA